jgi:predicted double-glycine peptidase
MQEDAYRGDGLNLYAYCANNPVMYYDPSGESSDCNHGADVEKNAQKENVTGEGESGTQYNQRVIKAIEKKKNFYRAEVDYYDCSEIADDLYKASGENGTIYTITPNEKHNLVVPEYGKNVSFDYHTVYSDNSYVYDPRYDNTPIPESEYFDMIKMLNPKGIMINKD